MIHAAGILFSAGARVLLLRRSGEGDHAGEWALPGGKIEDGETPEQAAERECREELGECPDGAREPFAHRRDETVDYTTFRQAVTDQFQPALNNEHDGFVWARIGDWPTPMHPGMKDVLDKLHVAKNDAAAPPTELDAARGVRDGLLPSPWRFGDMWLFALRVTGTGLAYRAGDKEYAWRDPSIYLNDEFLARCNGVPIIVEHPQKEMLDTKEYLDRNIGSSFLPYINKDEVWTIARIYDAKAAKMMAENQLSTSPGVVFGKGQLGEKIPMEDDHHLLIEGTPQLISHFAVVPAGVWDKQGEPTGVSTATAGDYAVSETASAAPIHGKTPDPAAETHQDGDKLDKILAHMDGLHSKHDASMARHDEHAKRLDAMCDRMDAMEARTKKDTDSMPTAEMPPVAEADRKDGTAEAVDDRKDAKRKDGEKEEKEEERHEIGDARKDSAAAVAKADEALRLARQLQPLSDADQSLFADAQARWDSVAQMFGKQAPRPMLGDTVLGYRKKMAKEYQRYSPLWAGVDISAMSADAFGVADAQIRNDAAAAGRRPTDIPAGTFREHVTIDPYTGSRKIDFFGPQTIFETMAGRSQAVTKFLTERRGH